MGLNSEKKILDFDEDMELDLRKLIKAIFQKKLVITFVAIIGMVFGIGFAKLKKKPTYQAKLTMYIVVENDENKIIPESSSDITLRVNTVAELLKSGEVLSEVIKQANLNIQTDQLIRSGKIKTTVKVQTQVIDVEVSFDNEKDTLAVAQKLAEIAPVKIGSLMHDKASIEVVTTPSQVQVTPVSLRSYGLKGFMAGFGLSFLGVVALALFDHQYPKKKSDE